ncbi:tenascin-X-like isoform X2 [Erythrolamprus reginae]|uniref:tenascin-X-like isoform X2 n=1 Tax=Erythrolamprus reginae TaxID=121349 RepID=UPI00396C75FC
MERASKGASFLLLLCWLWVSWGARLPRPLISSNATIFSHVYTIKLAGEDAPNEGPSPPPQEALGPPGSSRGGGGQFEHTLEGSDQEHVVFTHHINLPQQSCGCPPGTEDTRELWRRLQALENEVRVLQETCQAGGGCCPAVPASSQASEGQTDIRTLCSHHGSFDLSRCLCECESGWGGPTCAEPVCSGGCGGSERGRCVNGHCQCQPGYSGVSCEEPPSCPDDCNDQGRCVDGRCTCFPGYVGPSCSDPVCPQNCDGHGQCVSGRCVCNPGYSGVDCATRACPSNCNRRGECLNGRCVCESGFTGPACGTKTCPNDCNQRGHCLQGGVCSCHPDYTGPDCGQLACPEHCSGHGECQNGTCVCNSGYSGDDCSIEIPSIGVRVANRDETSFRLEWNYPEISVDGYEIHVAPRKNPRAGESIHLSGTQRIFEYKGLKPGEEYTVTVRVEKGQLYGPPVTQTVRTRVAPPTGLQSSQVSGNSLTLQWDPPTSQPDGYILSYVPLTSTRPVKAMKRVELPAAPERITLEDLESRTRYRITLVARQSGENSRATSIVVSTTAPAPIQPSQHLTPPPSSHKKPDTPSSEPERKKPGTTKPHPGRRPANTTLLTKENFLKRMTQNISSKLSPYNGTLLERLESYLRATHFPLRGNQTIQSVARDIYFYLKRTKPIEFQDRVEERLVQETSHLPPKREFPISEAESAYSDGYLRPDHAKPTVVTSSPDHIEVSLDSVRGISDHVVIRYRNMVTGERKELVVPGNASTATITGLSPGTTYLMEIHGVMKGHSSKSYSFITATAPSSPTNDKIQTIVRPTSTPEAPLKDIQVTEVSPNQLRVTWSAPPDYFLKFFLYYRDPKSGAPPKKISIPGTERSVDLTGLQPGTNYEIELHGGRPGGSHNAPFSTKINTAPSSPTNDRIQIIARPTSTPEAPLKDIQVTEVSPNQLRVTWSAPPDYFLKFFLYYRDPKSGKPPKKISIPGTERSVDLTGLQPGTNYEIELHGERPGETHNPPFSTKINTAPSSPTNDRIQIIARPTSTPEAPLKIIQVTEVSPNQLRVTWSAPPDYFLKFFLYYRDPKSGAPPKKISIPGTERSVNLKDLHPGTEYEIELHGERPGGSHNAPFSTKIITVPGSPTNDRIQTIARPTSTPEAPLKDIQVTKVSPNQLRVTWSAPLDYFLKFFLYYRDPKSGAPPKKISIPGTERSVDLTGLQPGTNYEIELHGERPGGSHNAPFSTKIITATSSPTNDKIQTIAQPTSIPEAPLKDIQVTEISPNQLRVTWSAPPDYFLKFFLYYRDPKSGAPPKKISIPGTERSVNLTGLQPGTNYEIELHGERPGGSHNAPFSTKINTAPGSPTNDKIQTIARPTSTPEAPLKDIQVTEVSPNQLRVTWSAPPDYFLKFFLYYRDPKSGAPPKKISIPGTERSVDITGLQPGTEYEIELHGERPGGTHNAPFSTKIITEAELEEPRPGDFSLLDVTDTSVHLSWGTPTGPFDSFVIQYRDADGKPKLVKMGKNSREATISNLVPSRKYKFNFYVLLGRKPFGPVSLEVVPGSGSTTKTAAFKDISATVTSDSAHLSWTMTSGNFDSFLIQYKDAEGRLQELFTEGDSREITIPNLAPSHRYTIDLYGISNQGRVGPASITFITGPQEDVSVHKTVLRDLAVSEVTSNSVHLTWRVPSGRFDSFLLQYQDSEGNDQDLRMDGDSREVIIPNLVPTQRYRFSLYGILGTQRLGPLFADAVTAAVQEPKKKKTDETIGIKPSLGEFSVLDVTSNTVHLYWTVPTGSFDSFLIQYKDVDGQPQALPVEGDSREVIVTNLTPSRRYKFNLYGVSGRKRSVPLSTDATTAHVRDSGEPTPVQPSLGEFSVLDVMSDSVKLQWTVPTGNFDSFLIQYKDADGQPQALPVEGGFREVTVTNLAPSRRYKFNLYGVSGRKRSTPVSTDATTAQATEPQKPPSFQASLGELSVLDVTSDSVRLQWTVSTGSFDSFLVQYKDADGQPQALPVEGDSREITLTNLVPSRRYKFNLYGVSGRKRSNSISTFATTARLENSEEQFPVQSTLGEFSVLDVTSDSVRLHWTVPTGRFDSFLVQYKDAEGQPQALTVEGDSREVTVPKLVPSRRYKFNLYGVSGKKRSRPLATEATTVPMVDSEEPVPIQPNLGEFSVLNVTSDSVRLYWTVSTESYDSFLIQYKDANGQPQALPIEGSSNQVTVTNLTPSHRYKFNLYGVSGHKRSNPLSTDATTASITYTKEPIPVQPSLGEFSILDVTTDSVRLHWTVPTGSFDSFLVQYKDSDGQPQALPVEGDSREVRVTNLAPSRRYKFNLYGVSGRKRSGPLSTDATTAQLTDSEEPILMQARLGEFSILDVTSDSVHLHWTVSTGSFDSFLIQYKDADGQPQVLDVEGDSREVTVTNLAPSRRYKFNLYGVSGRKRSSPMSTDATTAHITYTEEPIPVQPSLGEISVLDVTPDSVRLHWTVSTGSFDSFLVQYKDADGQPQALPVEGGSREVTVTNLVPSRRYKFNLYGISGRKRSSPLSTDATTVSKEAIGVQPSLGELSVLDVTSNSVRLHWTVPTGSFDSFLIQYKDADGQPQALPVEGGFREVTVINLAPSRKYKFNLYGISGRKRSRPLSTEATTVRLADSEEPVPIQPSLGVFSVLDVTSDSARLYWTVSTGNFDSFLIQYNDADGQPQALPIEGSSNQVTVTNLAPSRKYKFNLYGISGRKRSSPLSTDATTAHLTDSEDTNPIQPSLGEFSALDITSDSVRLYWTVSTGSFDSFLIQYKDADGQPQALPIEGNSREVTVTKLAPSRRYKFNLYGIVGRKRSSSLSTDATTVPLANSEEPVPIQPSLGELSVVDVTSNSVRLHWTVSTGRFDSFLIQYKDSDGQPQALPVEGGSNEVTVTNLAPSRRYKFNLYGVSGRKRSRPLSIDVTTARFTDSEEPIPVQPNLGEFSVLNVTSDSVHLYWTVPTGSFNSFLIQYKDADGQPQALPIEGGSHEVTVTNLAPSHRYKFNLYGVSGRKRSSPLSTDATTAHVRDSGEQIPVQPNLGDFSVLDVMSDSVRLHWTVSTGAFDSFLIQYKDADGQPQALPVDGDSREVTVSNLVPSRRYKFNLYGISGRKRSSPLSTDATTVSKEAIGVQPSLGELSVLDVTSDSVRLHWTVPTGAFDSFLVQYKDADGQPQALPVEGGFHEVTVTNLVPSRRYKFNLYGVSGRKRSGPLSTDATTAQTIDSEPAIPSQPTLGELSVLDITSNSVHLYWTVPTGTFDSFLVQYKDADGQPQALPVDGGSREVTVTNLAPSHKYKFLLYGVSGRKKTSVLSADAFTDPPSDPEEPIPVQPTLGELSVLDVTSDSVRLHWTVPTGNFDSFLIQYKDTDGQLQSLPVEGSSTEVTVTSLAPSRRYKFNLYGISGDKHSSPLAIDATTGSKEAVPIQPSLGELSVLDVTSDSVRLHWTVPTGSFDSFLVQYKDADGQPQALPVEGDSHEVTVTNLAPSRRYKFNLYGVSGRKRSRPLSADATTATPDLQDSTIPPSLGELSASGITSNSVHLSWSVPTGQFDSFAIQYKDAVGRPQAIPVEGDLHEMTIPNLVPSRKYKFNLYGLSGRKRMGPVSVEAVTGLQSPSQGTEDNGPPGPSPNPSFGELSVSDVTSNSARLTWNIPAETFDSFQIQYKDAENKPKMVPVDKETNTVVIYYLLPSHRYKFNLYGISGRRSFGPITASTVTAPADNEKPSGVPGEVDQEVSAGIRPRLGVLSVPEVTSHSAKLSWTVPEGSFDSFSVQYKDADGRPQALPLRGDLRDVIISNLSPSHKYKFNLYGVFGKQRLGPISALVVTTAAETSGQVEEKKQPVESIHESNQPRLGDVTVSEVTPDSLLLSWNVQEGSFDSFIIQYKDASGNSQTVPVDGAMRSLHLYNLTSSHAYEFDIFGVSGFRHLGPHSVHTVTEVSEEERAIQPQLGDLSIAQVTSDSVDLFWTVAAGNFDSFLLQYKDSEGKPQVLPLNGTSRDITVTNLSPSHRYKFNLYGLIGRKRLGPISTNAVTGQGTQPLKLGTLSAHNITSESLLLIWTVESGNFDSFIIQYRDAAGKSHALPVDGGLRLLRFHDLVPSHRYKFNLYGVSRRKRLGPISVEAVTVPKPSGLQVAPQPKLGKLSVSDISDTSLRLTWRVLTGKFESFSIEYRDADGNPQMLPMDSNTQDVVISNLVPSHRYTFNLYGISQQKRFGPISTEAVTAQGKDFRAIPKLGDLSISEVTNDSVRLSWTISSGKFDSFLIRYKDDQGNPQTVPVPVDSRTVFISNLIPSHKYKFSLYGVSGKKQFGPVSIDAVTAAFSESTSTPAPLLDHLVVSEVTSTTLHLGWEVPEGEFDSFLVRWKDSLGSGQTPVPAKEIILPGDARSIILQELTPSTEYSLTVYGIKDESEVAEINTGTKTSGLELDGPQDLRFSDIHETSVVANWRPPASRIDGYKVSFQPSDGGEPKSIAVDESELRTIIEGLTPGASYEVAVMSIRGFEESEPLVGYITTVPDGPSDLRAVNVTDTSAVLTWRPAVAEMNNYIVTYGPITSTGSQVSESVPGNRVQLQLSELQRDMEYWANVYGEKEGNRSSPISATFTTGADGPRDLRATEIFPRSARLTWSPPGVPSEGYLLSYETPDGQSKEIPLDASVTSYKLQDLIPSSRYQVQVQAVRRGTPTASISTSFTTGHLTFPFPRDCSEEIQNGPGASRVTTIYLGGNRERPLRVFCDMETDGGGWIVFQRRMNGETDFWRDWQNYALGFGNLTREFWLGNNALHQLTSSGDYELRVDLRAGEESVYATYQNFRVDPPADHYRLHLGSYQGTAGDALSYHSGSVFSTRDRDPNRVIIPCAISYRGAWWYRNCHYTNLNGLYANNRDHQGVNWFNWKGFEFSIPFTEMKLRPSSFHLLQRS